MLRIDVVVVVSMIVVVVVLVLVTRSVRFHSIGPSSRGNNTPADRICECLHPLLRKPNVCVQYLPTSWVGNGRADRENTIP